MCRRGKLLAQRQDTRRRGCDRWSIARARSGPARRSGARAAWPAGSRRPCAGDHADRAPRTRRGGRLLPKLNWCAPRSQGRTLSSPVVGASTSTPLNSPVRPPSTAPPPGPTCPLYIHGVPDQLGRLDPPFLEHTGGVAPDLIGFGRSGKAGNLDYSIDGLTDFVEMLLSKLEIDCVKLFLRRPRLGRADPDSRSHSATPSASSGW